VKQAEITPKDYYQVLGVSQTASSRQIKSAYRNLARTYHPDVPETGSTGKMAQINEAYEVLSIRANKTAYDHLMREQRLYSEKRANKANRKATASWTTEPLMMAFREAIKGKSKEEIIEILVQNGTEEWESVKVTGEVFEIRADLAKKPVADWVKLASLILILAVIMVGIAYAIAYVNFTVIFLVLVVAIYIIAHILRLYTNLTE